LSEGASRNQGGSSGRKQLDLHIVFLEKHYREDLRSAAIMYSGFSSSPISKTACGKYETQAFAAKLII